MLEEAAGEKRKLPMLIAPLDARSIAFLNPNRGNKQDPRLPFSQHLLGAVLKKLGYHVQKAIITDADVKEDAYTASIIISDGKDHTFSLTLRAPDAVALGLYFDAPIVTDDAILQESDLTMMMIHVKIKLALNPPNPEKASPNPATQLHIDNLLTHNLNLHPLPILQDLLHRMIEREDYEKAARIRDEISRRS